MAYDSLLVCPKNLKECIDWVLRATGKDNGTGNDIDKLNKAVNAVLPSFKDDSIDLTQLVQGLCLFMGYPSCLCKPKKSVKESLRKISKELKGELKNYECLSKPSLNCSSCSTSSVVCKCCVLDCISKVLKSQCQCVQDSKNNDCSCSIGEPKRCCKDLLEKLKASLSLLNLKADMEKLCQCPPDCCVNGKCTNTSQGCPVCKPSKTLKPSNDYTVTGLGLLRPSPKRLAERLNDFFGDSSSKSSGCSCTCNGSGPTSCCCLACQSCSKACSCNTSGCSCAQALKASQCPRKKFCEAIKDIKIAAESTDMTCCTKGTQCHCQLDRSCSTSGQCCVEQLNGSKKQNYHQSLKCLIRRLVKFFNGLPLDPSQPNCSKLCCEIFCVLKMCESFKTFYDKRTATVCNTCRKKGKGVKGGCSKAGNCCKGPNPKCPSGSTGTFCSTCSECRQICDSKKFYRELQTLQYSGPCGLDLYRLLKDFLNFIRNVFMPQQNFIHSTVLEAVNSCNNCGKSGTDSKNWQACQCSGSSCTACTSLLQDSKLMSILRHGYVSSYDSKASWTSLTPSTSGSKCCGSLPSCTSCQPNCSPGSLCSNPSLCCPDCPQRKAAKIFLGMLPCLYYGLKILYARAQDPLTWPDWQKISILSDKPSSDLAKFLKAWGYDLRPLISKKGSEFFPLLDSLSTLKVLEKFSTLVTENYFTSHLISSGSLSPSTVRELLLWLYGLRFQKHFSDLVENCKSLCLPFGNSFHPDAFCYYIHTCCFLAPIAIISAIETSDYTVANFFSDAHSEISKFHYPSDPFALLETLFLYVRKIYIPLKFLQYQCERNPSQAGWQECFFGQNCVKKFKENSPASLPSISTSCCPPGSGQGILCTTIIGNSNPHEHCISSKSGVSCRGLDSKCPDESNSNSKAHTSGNCKPCPHHLMRFLIDGSENSKNLKNLESPFQPPEGFPPMGFSKENLSSPGRHGHVLHDVLKPFCTNGFYPLTRLLQFSLCIFRNPPDNLGELFAFFVKFKESGVFKNYFESYVDGEPGFYSGEDLKSAVRALYGSEESHKNSSHPSDLRSLIACDGPKGSSTCGRYLHPLTYNAYHGFIEDFLDTYLSWICYSAEKFKEKLEDFYNEALTKSLQCCQSSSCTKIVECPCAHPFLYSYGFTFVSPNTLNGTNKKSCQDFIAQLEKVANGDPFKKLLEEIPKFIWSIREPFFLFVLAFWAFVISYFLYVQLYKLDLLHIDSRLHLPRSFKILPSTLFSDASSKLKDLSYFTL